MENASKALIIAGAILLSILLISLGIFIFTNASDQVKKGNLDEEQVQTFNAQFLQYEGKQRGTGVKQLLNKAIASNANADNIDAGAKVTLNGEESISTSQVSTSKTYNVELEYDTTTGRVNNIKIDGLEKTKPNPNP